MSSPFFPAGKIFELVLRWCFWRRGKPVSIYNMIDYDIFTKLITKDCECER